MNLDFYKYCKKANRKLLSDLSNNIALLPLQYSLLRIAPADSSFPILVKKRNKFRSYYLIILCLCSRTRFIGEESVLGNWSNEYIIKLYFTCALWILQDIRGHMTSCRILSEPLLVSHTFFFTNLIILVCVYASVWTDPTFYAWNSNKRKNNLWRNDRRGK